MIQPYLEIGQDFCETFRTHIVLRIAATVFLSLFASTGIAAATVAMYAIFTGKTGLRWWQIFALLQLWAVMTALVVCSMVGIWGACTEISAKGIRFYNSLVGHAGETSAIFKPRFILWKDMLGIRREKGGTLRILVAAGEPAFIRGHACGERISQLVETMLSRVHPQDGRKEGEGSEGGRQD